MCMCNYRNLVYINLCRDYYMDDFRYKDVCVMSGGDYSTELVDGIEDGIFRGGNIVDGIFDGNNDCSNTGISDGSVFGINDDFNDGFNGGFNNGSSSSKLAFSFDGNKVDDGDGAMSDDTDSISVSFGTAYSVGDGLAGCGGGSLLTNVSYSSSSLGNG